MPNILIRIPKDSFQGEARAQLMRQVTEAASKVEQIPDESKNRMMCWILVEEISSGSWSCGGVDLTSTILPCMAEIFVPAGVLTKISRETYVKVMDEAFRSTQASDDKRQIATSIILHEIEDGQWGVNGRIWPLSQFVRAAGFEHLQHLVT